MARCIHHGFIMTEALLKGTTLGLLLAISIGPIVFTVIKQSLVNGHKGGLFFIAGISLSDILLVVCSNLFTGLFDLLNAHKRVLSVVASIFLILAGIFYIFFKKVKEIDNRDTGEGLETHDQGTGQKPLRRSQDWRNRRSHRIGAEVGSSCADLS